MKTFESSLDKPKAGLDGAVWTEDWPPYLNDIAQSVINQVVAYAQSTFKLPPFKLHIIGSITSNQWTPTTDIDLHFCCPTFRAAAAEEFNKLFRDWFKNVYVAAGNPSQIAEHPIEIYMQPNEMQDYMSVGCYDVLERKWDVGPDLAPLDYNPIAAWWNIDMQKVDETVTQMRDVILRCYETSKALKAIFPGNEAFDSVAEMLANYVAEAAQLLKKAKEERKINSEPTSKEQAIALRNSEEWKIADTSFKLLDKYGYLAILKKCADLEDRFKEDDSDKQAAAAELLCTIQSNLSPTNYLSESKKVEEANDEKLKIWVDDVRPAPNGYKTVQSVNQFIDLAEKAGIDNIAVVDIDHDAGDFQKDGGDYIKILDWLEFNKAENLNVRIHSANPVGAANMRRIIRKNGWTEVFDVVESDEVEWQNEDQLEEFDVKIDPNRFKCKVVKKHEDGEDVWSVETADPKEGGWVATFHDEIAAEQFAEEYPELKAKYLEKAAAVSLDESISNEDDYIKNFKDKFGYQDDYVCKDNVGDVAQKIAKECALRMPYDTAAREIEGDAVMLLVSSGDKEAIDAGKALGDFMLATNGKEHDEEQLLKLMSGAYIKLKELEHKEETDESEQQVDEGAKEWLSLAAICGMLAIPGLMPNDALAAEMKKVPTQQLKVNSPAMKDAMKNATVDTKSYNGMNATNVVNAVARTIYAEAKAEGTEGLDAIASVIWNRAGGNADNFISIVSKKSKKTNKCQFSCWNKYSGGWKDATYRYSIPSLKELANATSKEAWNHSIELAKKMLAGTFKSTIGNRNSYMNKELADKKNIDSWGKDLDLKIGKHHFGYFSYNDGFKTKGSKTTPQQKIYVVKDGDTLWKIAKANSTTVDELKAKNQLDNPDKLKIGQKLRV